MAVEIVQRYLDDVDGEPIPEGEVNYVLFSVGRKRYELHLNDVNLEKFNETVGFYVDKAREVKQTASTKTSTRAATKAGTPKEGPNQHPSGDAKPGLKRPGIRKWANEHGFEVGRGRVSLEVEAAYDAAHGIEAQ